MSNKADLVFVVLVYRNSKDIKNLIESISENINLNRKIIIVNSFYDETSKEEIQKIAEDTKSDFLNIPNKGYGYGNNKGIEFAKNNYIFDYLIVCNPDTIIQEFEIPDTFDKNDSCIIAPKILTLTKKNQNPYYKKKSNFKEWILYNAYKRNIKNLFFLSNLIGRIQREFFEMKIKILRKKKMEIYASHGSFLVFSSKMIFQFEKIYDENIFLFSEENDLARLCYENKIPMYYFPDLKIIHKEDGSMGFVDHSLIKYKKQSFMYYYEKWKLKK